MRCILAFFSGPCYGPSVPATRETLDDLLAPILADGRVTAFAVRAGLRPYTLLRLRQGIGSRTHAGTVAVLARSLRVSQARVRAAIEASRAAKE